MASPAKTSNYCWGLVSRSAPHIEHVGDSWSWSKHRSCSPMEFTLYLICYVSFAISPVVLLEIHSLRPSESDLFTTILFYCLLSRIRRWSWICHLFLRIWHSFKVIGVWSSIVEFEKFSGLWHWGVNLTSRCISWLSLLFVKVIGASQKRFCQ